VGEGANTWQLSGRLLPEKLGGLAELDVLHLMRISGLPQYLMRGDGKPLGWVVIESVSEKSSYLGSNGVGQIIEVSISLRRSRKPENSSFFSIISGLFS
jgi:phage protein U